MLPEKNKKFDLELQAEVIFPIFKSKETLV